MSIPPASRQAWPAARADFPGLGDLFLRTPGSVTMYGYLPVVFMCAGSAGLIWLVSLLTFCAEREDDRKYFQKMNRR